MLSNLKLKANQRPIRTKFDFKIGFGEYSGIRVRDPYTFRTRACVRVQERKVEPSMGFRHRGCGNV